MLIEIILSIIGGIFFGTITGLLPGIHINLISSLLISITSIIYLNPLYAISFITSMSITHTFIDFIPSIFLGCPDTETELSILPGHKLLMERKGFEAIYLSNKGSLIAIVLFLFLIIPSIYLLKNFYNLFINLIPYILILISIILLLTGKNKFNSLIVFLLTGLLGYSINSLNINQPLLPLLTGLFGASNIIISIKNKTKIPKQKITKPKISLKEPIIGSIISAPLCGLLPGLGAGQAAIISKSLIKTSQKQFILLLGIINTLVMSFSFLVLFTLNKTRTGSAVAIKSLIQNLRMEHFILIIIIIIISSTISYFLTNFLAKYFSSKIHKINYKKLATITLLMLSIVILLVSGIIGFFVFFASTLTGIYSINLKVRRTNMMGSLIIPTILWYLI